MRPNRIVEPATGSETNTEASTDSEARTEEIPVAADAPPERRRRNVLTTVTGILAGALVVLALAMAGAQVFSAANGLRGPGLFIVAAHVVGAVLAVVAQRRADRSTGGRRTVAAWTVVALFVLVVGVFWWAWLYLFWSF